MNFWSLFLVGVLLGSLFVTTAKAHEGEQHDTAHVASTTGLAPTADPEAAHLQPAPTANTPTTAELSDFPTLHPLVVHFPIVLLLIAALTQLAQFVVFRRELSWVTLVLLALGFATAYISASFTHPHTHGLSEHARAVLQEHDQYASFTLWLSGIAVLLKAGTFWLPRYKVWGEAVVALVLIGAAYSVSMAGHHGSQLAYLEGVGPQGRFLESQEEEGEEGHQETGEHKH
ncbi:Uncharacterized membrane protein [Catalinimonas alkaloidigena]|uniref:Uncharacterized membrane protein n=1 Tax=Catalinimonas alkaloidigena TaxID=1075417 RepID=A0A1G9U5F9_9BACT|nr:DUF2231 domain-containing protein [Catalinimonas alkaloidigena]SDM55186.1 Uncharacterized membrane protein [Catalinimonas alkaloidigena]